MNSDALDSKGRVSRPPTPSYWVKLRLPECFGWRHQRCQRWVWVRKLQGHCLGTGSPFLFTIIQAHVVQCFAVCSLHRSANSDSRVLGPGKGPCFCEAVRPCCCWWPTRNTSSSDAEVFETEASFSCVFCREVDIAFLHFHVLLWPICSWDSAAWGFFNQVLASV